MASKGPILEVTQIKGEIPLAAVAFRYISKPISSSKASAPAAISASDRATGPTSTFPARNTSAVTALWNASPPRLSFRNSKLRKPLHVKIKLYPMDLRTPPYCLPYRFQYHRPGTKVPSCVRAIPLSGKGSYLSWELAFVDHANRRGSIRIDGNGRFRLPSPPLSPYCHTVW